MIMDLNFPYIIKYKKKLILLLFMNIALRINLYLVNSCKLFKKNYKALSIVIAPIYFFYSEKIF